MKGSTGGKVAAVAVTVAAAAATPSVGKRRRKSKDLFRQKYPSSRHYQ